MGLRIRGNSTRPNSGLASVSMQLASERRTLTMRKVGKPFRGPSMRQSAIGFFSLLTLLWTGTAGGQAPEPMAVLLEWEHPFPAQVALFKVHFAESEEEQKNSLGMEVGTPGSQGRYSWPLSVEPDQSIWVAVQAVGPTGLGSPLSEWRRYDWKPGSNRLGTPGRPTLVEDASP